MFVKNYNSAFKLLLLLLLDFKRDVPCKTLISTKYCWLLFFQTRLTFQLKLWSLHDYDMSCVTFRHLQWRH